MAFLDDEPLGLSMPYFQTKPYCTTGGDKTLPHVATVAMSVLTAESTSRGVSVAARPYQAVKNVIPVGHLELGTWTEVPSSSSPQFTTSVEKQALLFFTEGL